MKRPKVEEIEEVKTVYPVYTRDPSGLSGVAKYLDKQEAALLASISANEQEQQEPVQIGEWSCQVFRKPGAKSDQWRD